MTTPTLETVPEETVAPVAAPAATPERVTSDVPKTKPATAKNPGRVASGRRLAERNRLTHEAKKQDEAQKPTTSTTNNTNTSTNTTEQSSGNNTNTSYLLLGIGGLIVSVLGLYYQREAIISGKAQKPVEPIPVAKETPPSPKPKVKCGIIKMK